MDLIVLGVDGVDPEILEKTIEEREVPNWERLKQEAFYTELPSTVPAVTIPAWVSMFSGYNPGEFGSYHLSQPDYEEWELNIPRSHSFRGLFFWDRTDIEVGLHYVPGTSPAYEVNGWMRAGFPSAEDFDFYPEELGEEFGGLERENASNRSGSRKKIEADTRNFETERRIADRIMEKDPEVFVSVVRFTDEAVHHAEKMEQVLDIYEEVDEEIGRIIDMAEEENADLIVASDHGFFQSKKKFNISRFLEENGWLETEGETESLLYRLAEPFLDTPLKKYLKYVHEHYQDLTGEDLSGKTGNPLDPISKDSKVLPAHFGLGKDCLLKVHAEDMSRGNVTEEEREEILDELEEKLLELERNGEEVVGKVWRGEELYGNSDIDIAFRTSGDFIVETAPSGKLFEKTNTFTHRENGIFFATGPKIDEEADEELEITDVAPLVYALLGETVPGDLDGELPEKLVPEIEPEYRSTELDEIDI